MSVWRGVRSRGGVIFLAGSLLVPPLFGADAPQADQPSGSPQQPPSPSRPGDPGQSPAPASSPAPAPAPADRDVSWKKLAPNVLTDQKRIWLFPLSLNNTANLVPFLVATGATAGLIRLDPTVGPYFRRSTYWNSFNSAFSTQNTALATALFPLAFYGVSLIDHDSYAQKTALLAGEAVIDVEILDFVMKGVTRRLRPGDIPPNGNFNHTFFKNKAGFFHDSSSFPSGHAIASFAIATVFAHRYRSHKWVPWAAYGAATLICFSRITQSAHFPSDVFVGGVLGYAVAQYAVLRP